MNALKQYLTLEQAMLQLDADGATDIADVLRDHMDAIWYEGLSTEDRAKLNSRGFVEYQTQQQPQPPEASKATEPSARRAGRQNSHRYTEAFDQAVVVPQDPYSDLSDRAA